MGVTCSSARIQQLLRINQAKNKHCVYEAVRKCDALVLARLLLYQTDVNIDNRQGLSPLHVACEIGNANLVQILISMGADVNRRTRADQGAVPPVVFAAGNGHAAVVRTLLEAGAAVDAADRWGCTALFKAATYNHVDCVKVLLKHRARTDRANRWGALPLQYAALQGHDRVVRALVRSGADVDARGERSVPPALVAAVMRGFQRCTSALLEAGASVDICFNAINSHQEEKLKDTALVYAIRYAQHALNEMIVDSLTQVTMSDRLKCIETLLEHGAAVTSSTVSQLCTMGDDGVYNFPNFSTEISQGWELRLIRVVLRAMVYKGTSSEISVLRNLYHEVAQTMAVNVPLMRKLANLIVSVGLDPNEKDVEAICYVLNNDELGRLRDFRKSPRKLMDKCRLVIRGNMQCNVLAGVDGLPLPSLLKDYITLDSPQLYSLA